MSNFSESAKKANIFQLLSKQTLTDKNQVMSYILSASLNCCKTFPIIFNRKCKHTFTQIGLFVNFRGPLGHKDEKIFHSVSRSLFLLSIQALFCFVSPLTFFCSFLLKLKRITQQKTVFPLMLTCETLCIGCLVEAKIKSRSTNSK